MPTACPRPAFPDSNGDRAPGAAGPAALAPRLCTTITLLAGLLGAVAAPARANPCDAAAARAAAETGVPLSLLRAIARAESGRAASGDPAADPAPWPWAIQHDGTAAFPATREAARAAAEALVAAGETNVDIGCFQINLRWHGAAFASVDDMLDPDRNAAYAARLLADLYARLGDWRAATGAYHSGDAERAADYTDRVALAHERRLAATAAAPAEPAAAPPARFALTAATGALLTAARGPLVGGP